MSNRNPSTVAFERLADKARACMSQAQAARARGDQKEARRLDGQAVDFWAVYVDPTILSERQAGIDPRPW